MQMCSYVKREGERKSIHSLSVTRASEWESKREWERDQVALSCADDVSSLQQWVSSKKSCISNDMKVFHGMEGFTTTTCECVQTIFCPSFRSRLLKNHHHFFEGKGEKKVSQRERERRRKKEKEREMEGSGITYAASKYEVHDHEEFERKRRLIKIRRRPFSIPSCSSCFSSSFFSLLSFLLGYVLVEHLSLNKWIFIRSLLLPTLLFFVSSKKLETRQSYKWYPSTCFRSRKVTMKESCDRRETPKGRYLREREGERSLDRQTWRERSIHQWTPFTFHSSIHSLTTIFSVCSIINPLPFLLPLEEPTFIF